MKCEKCGKGKSSCLCPVSLGLALGVTCFLGMFFMSVAVMNGYVPPPEMTALKPEVTWSLAFTHSLWALLRGFVFGFVLAFFYNMFACCMRMCCRRSDKTGECCQSKDSKPDVK
jgi:hypothetical protein